MKIALIAVGLVFFVLVVVGLLLPTHFARSRSISIRAAPARVHAIVDDLERWPDWTPWEKDPSLAPSLGRITRGVGATRTWTGADGSEELKIVSSDPATGITYEMIYRRGDETAVMKGGLALRAIGAATEVTWSMEGDMHVPVLGGYVVLVGGGAIDSNFDRGLVKLKQIVEGK